MRRRKGFTLAETLIVVAIIVVLGALSTIMVFNYQRKMKQMEMDSAAKEIFLAAQNHLSVAYSQGYLAKMVNADPEAGASALDCFGHKEKTEVPDDEVFYFIVGGDTENYDSRSDNGSLLSSILPFAAVDETTLSQGSYIIRYNRSSGLILDVFYVNKEDSRFGCCFSADTTTEYEELMANWRGEANADKRRNYGILKAVIGYYGGVADDYGVIKGTATLSEPSFVVNNSNRLTLTILDKNQIDPDLRDVSLKLVMKGLSSGVQKEYLLIDKGIKSEKAPAGFDWTFGETGTLVLDSLNDRYLHFAEMFKKDGFYPGENLELKLISFSEGTLTNVAESGVQTTNSLFADYDGSHTVKIGNFRHLENLSAAVSAFDQAAPFVNCAEQITDLFWENYVADVTGDIWPMTGDKTPRYYYRPVVTASAITYEGKGHSISNVAIAEKGTNAAGLFGSLSGSTVKNLELVDFAVSSEKGCAGALAGEVVGGKIYGVLARNSGGSFYDTEKIVGTDIAIQAEISGFYAGGLVGKLNAATVDCCAAAVYVRGVERSSAAGDASAAGGLVGMAAGTIHVTNSYSGGHTSRARYQDISDGEGHINVLSEGWAGGLIGWASVAEDSEIAYCYSTCSANGTRQYAAGFIGELEQGTVKDCYCTGRVSGPAVCSYFIGIFRDNTVFAGANYYLTNITVLKKNEVTAEDNRLVDTASTYMTNVHAVNAEEAAASGLIVARAENAVTTAYAYDHTLSIDFGGNYYFKTVKELNPGAPDEAFIKVHYGDWQIPQMASLSHTVKNEDVLSLVIYASDERLQGVRSIAVAVLGEQSNNARLFRMNLEQAEASEDNPTGITVTISGYGYAVNGASRWFDITEVAGTEAVPAGVSSLVPVVGEDAGNNIITVIFDDITQTDKHFDQLFCSFDDAGNLLPGENIYVYASSSDKLNADISWSELHAGEWVPSSSLYAYEKDFTPELDTDGTTNITFIKNIRHLENLDARISHVGEKSAAGKTLTFQTAQMIDDITWDSFYERIYPVGGTTAVEGFLAIYAPELKLFDGADYTISQLPIHAVSSGITTLEPGSVGLFAKIDGDLTVQNLKMEDFDLSGEAAGYLAGKLTSGADLKLNGVLAVSRNKVVTGSSYAGGLIGMVGSGAKAAIFNSAASVKVSSNAAAGGLVGAVTGGQLSITESYVGGHVYDGSDSDLQGRFDMRSASSCNIVGGAQAGGLVGDVQSGSNVQITRAFCAASVAGTNGNAGGLVGRISGNSVKLDTVNCLAPVFGAADGQATVGSLIGYADTALSNASSLYNLPEIYHGKAVSDVRTEGSSSRSGIVAHSAYYAAAPADSEEDVNSIAGTVKAADGTYPTLIYKTIPYASSMTRSANEGVREFPYSIWTHFDFDLNNFSGSVSRPPYFGTYYGDWEVASVSPTVMHSVTFNYTLDGAAAEVSFGNTQLEAQKLIEGFDNTIILPGKNLPGYQLIGWDMYDALDNKRNSYDAGSTTINLAAQYCSSNLKFVARYASNGNYALTFYTNYNSVSGSFDNSWAQKNASITVAGTTLLSSLSLTSYQESLEDYVFECWCSNAELTDMLPITDTTTVAEWSMLMGGSKELKVYPRYKLAQYYPINIDFYYTLNADATELKDFYLVNGYPRYELQNKMDTDFTETVALPSYEGYELLLIVNRDSDVKSGDAGVGSWSVSKDGLVFDLKADYLKKNGGASFYAVYYLSIPEASEMTGYTVNLHYSHAENNKLEYSETKEYVSKVTGSDMVGRVPNVTIPDAPDGYYIASIHVGALTTNPEANNYHVYYERQTYELSFDSRGGSFDYDAMDFYWGQPVNLFTLQPWKDWTAGKLKKTGYVFDGWNVYEKGYEDDNHRITTPSFNMDTKDLVAVAMWKPGPTTYRVSYWYENIAGDGWLYMGSTGKIAATSGDLISPNVANPYTYLGSNVPEVLTKEKSHFTLNLEKSKSVTAAGDGTTVLNLYFDRNFYTITFLKSNSGHEHKLDCYAINQNVKITEKTLSHIHGVDCYEGLGTKIVTDTLSHTHTAECYGLGTTFLEYVSNNHATHSKDCYVGVGSEMTSKDNGHTSHDTSCFEGIGQEIKKDSSCGNDTDHSVKIDSIEYAFEFNESNFTEFVVYSEEAAYRTGLFSHSTKYFSVVKIGNKVYVYNGSVAPNNTIQPTKCTVWPIGQYNQVTVGSKTYVVTDLNTSAAELTVCGCKWQESKSSAVIDSKMVKIGSTWYAYNGSQAVGTKIAPSCGYWCTDSKYYQVKLNNQNYHVSPVPANPTDLQVYAVTLKNVTNQSDTKNGKIVYFGGKWYYYTGAVASGKQVTAGCAFWFTGQYNKLVLNNVTYKVDNLPTNELVVTEVVLTNIANENDTRTVNVVRYNKEYYYYTGTLAKGATVPLSCESWFTGKYQDLTMNNKSYSVSGLPSNSEAVHLKIYGVTLTNVVDKNDKLTNVKVVPWVTTGSRGSRTVVWYLYEGDEAIGSIAQPIAEKCSNIKGSFSARYESNIQEQFDKLSDSDMWSSDYPEFRGRYVTALDTMPGSDITFWLHSERSEDDLLQYYVEVCQADIAAQNYDAIAKLQNGENHYFKLWHAVKYHLGSYYLTDAEEFHIIAGFNKWGHKTEVNKTNQVKNYNTITRYNGSFSSGSADVSFFYLRNTYDLTIRISKEDEFGELSNTDYVVEDVQYEAFLKDHQVGGKALDYYSGSAATDPHDGSVYHLYLDETHTDMVTLEEFNQIQMSEGGMMLFGYWTPPAYEISFYSSYDEKTGTYGPACDIDPIEVLRGRNADAQMTNQGKLLDTYKPTAVGKTFIDWYYWDTATNTAKRFHTGDTIRGDLKLYALWNDQFISGTTVEVEVLHVDGDTGEVLKKVEKAPYSVTGKPLIFYAETIPGYYPESMAQAVLITEDTEQIVFKYFKQTDWNYSIEYYIRLISAGDGTKYAKGTYTLPVPILTERGRATNLKNEVWFKLPAGYDGYSYLGYEFAHYDETAGKMITESGDEGMVEIYPTSLQPDADGNQAVIRFYLTINTLSMNAEDAYFTYDGTAHQTASRESTAMTSLPAGWKMMMDYVTNGSAVNAGSYPAKAGVTVIVPDEKLPYLITTMDSTIRILPIYLTVESEGGRITYNENKVELLLKNDPDENVSVKADKNVAKLGEVKKASNDGKYFAAGEGIDVYFAVDAFRVEQGVMPNSFTYKLYRMESGKKVYADSTNAIAGNYVIQTVFGQLVVE